MELKRKLKMVRYRLKDVIIGYFELFYIEIWDVFNEFFLKPLVWYAPCCREQKSNILNLSQIICPTIVVHKVKQDQVVKRWELFFCSSLAKHAVCPISNMKIRGRRTNKSSKKQHPWVQSSTTILLSFQKKRVRHFVTLEFKSLFPSSNFFFWNIFPELLSEAVSWKQWT